MKILLTKKSELSTMLTKELENLGHTVKTLSLTEQKLAKTFKNEPNNFVTKIEKKCCGIVFSSPNSVKIFTEFLGNKLTTKIVAHSNNITEFLIVAVGESTKKCLTKIGFKNIFSPKNETFSAKNLVDTFCEQKVISQNYHYYSTKTMCILTSNLSPKFLGQQLQAQGFMIENVHLYNTTEVELSEKEFTELITSEIIVTYSSSIITSLYNKLVATKIDKNKWPQIICFGQPSKIEAKNFGFKIFGTAKKQNINGILELMEAKDGRK